MAGLLGLPVLLEALASLGQRYDQAKGLLSNPSVTLRDLAQANAAQRADDRSWVGASQSVMPEVRAAAQERGMQAALNAGGLLGITAFHGSPHTFDKFDMSKIGTGEGAQAYGHGLYFAENPEVAQGYQTMLAGRSRTERCGRVPQRLGRARYPLSRRRKPRGQLRDQ